MAIFSLNFRLIRRKNPVCQMLLQAHLSRCFNLVEMAISSLNFRLISGNNWQVLTMNRLLRRNIFRMFFSVRLSGWKHLLGMAISSLNFLLI